MTFLFFSLGVLAVFGIATMRFGDYRAGLLAAAFIILSPRFFAESF
jgi:4-amino-4-deoxy-L-arabinose transferase-like glycosyltransferase